MNFVHRRLCRSGKWRSVLENFVVPSALADVQLGDDVLELGPGDGLTTDLLRPHIARITALELHPRTAKSLAARFAGTNVTALHGDASAIPLPDRRFTGAVSLHMLHHIPSAQLQDKVFREVCRVLKPGGVFVCIDSVNFRTLLMRLIHIADKITPVDPNDLHDRLYAAGFTEIRVDTNPYAFPVRARR
ncbi:MAG: class I SAM-dependent methyltransferase, partial [Acidobacteriota bacterium]|nr:class I SAM-dependent methyltransferase [Acidobacteriota bacterium]